MRNEFPRIMNISPNVSSLSRLIVNTGRESNFGIQQIRNKWANWQMIKDNKRRLCVKDQAIDRIRINTIRKNDILPAELREIADQEVAKLPRDSNYIRIVSRCAVTSRPRGVYMKYHLSRIVWRHLADYNKLAGVQRAMW